LKTNSYLYGSIVPIKIPKHIVDNRLVLLNTTLKETLAIPLKDRDWKKVSDIQEAKAFWIRLQQNKDI